MTSKQGGARTRGGYLDPPVPGNHGLYFLNHGKPSNIYFFALFLPLLLLFSPWKPMILNV